MFKKILIFGALSLITFPALASDLESLRTSKLDAAQGAIALVEETCTSSAVLEDDFERTKRHCDRFEQYSSRYLELIRKSANPTEITDASDKIWDLYSGVNSTYFEDFNMYVRSQIY
jgi:hypothetical protein